MTEELKEYGFKADEVFKTQLTDTIISIIKNIPEDLEVCNIVCTKNEFILKWREKKKKRFQRNKNDR